MDLLKHVHDPNFRGVVVRRLTPQLNGPGGIFETAENLYRSVFKNNLKVKRRDGVIQFPSGAKISFRHCQYEEDKHSFQGWQISEALVDEGQQLTETQVLYLMSRLRSEANMKPCMRITCNPDKNSYLRKWIDWYLDEDGFPDQSKCGKLRWFTMQNSEMIWANSKAEIQKLVPGCTPLSFTFINANVFDNPVMMERQPEYVAWLEGLNRVEKDRLLYGNWDAVEESAGYIKKEWFNLVTTGEVRPIKRVRAWDTAATIPSETQRDPDYTVGVLMSKNKDKEYTVEDVVRFRDRFAGVEQKILETAIKDGRDTIIVIPLDPGAAGKAYAQTLQQKLAEYGFTVVLDKTTASKLTRLGPFASMAEAGFVNVLKSDWNEAYFLELESFDGGKNSGLHDDQVDATSSAFNKLKTTVEIPNIALPSFDTSNPFKVDYN